MPALPYPPRRDTNGTGDVFVRDVLTGQTRRVGVSSSGAEANVGGAGRPAVSANGRYVAFIASADNLVPGDTNNELDVFVHDVLTGQTRRVSVTSTGAQANYGSGESGVAISADGQHIVFNSLATNLVPADMNDSYDVFVRDVATGQTRLVSRTSSGAQGNGPSLYQAISANGRYVAFNTHSPTTSSPETPTAYRTSFAGT